ncbi:MAG: penicillin-binding protein 2 [Chlorobi bacterium]|nr:penicillin-binding protein 2 [Chlorobiota bacterium]
MQRQDFTIEKKRYRRALVMGLTIALAFILVYKLYDMQVLKGAQYGSQSQRNAIRRVAKDPARGLIFDKDSSIIVNNDISYTLTITPFEFDYQTFGELVRRFNLDSTLVTVRLRHGSRVAEFEPVKVKRDLSYSDIVFLEENKHRFPGVNYMADIKRSYHMKPHMAHLIGYVREISARKLRNDSSGYYRPGDLIGYGGIEGFYEKILRGAKGYSFFTVDARGKVIENFDHGQEDIPSVEGSDLVLTIDLKLQSFVERMLRHHRAAMVAIDPRNGEILCFASSPDFDLKYFTGQTPLRVWKNLIENKDRPFFNRASMAVYPPGSTFKPLIAAAALQEGVITPSTKIYCPGSYTLAGVTFKCHGAHGNITVVRAIEVSCNVFFYKLIFKLGLKEWYRYGSMFHFGRKTGMDISDESPGVLPSHKYYMQRYGKKWNIGYLVNLGIGQGEISVTPLQMAAYTAVIANRGTYYRPHVVRTIIDRNHGGAQPVKIQKERIPIEDDVWDLIHKGMYRAVYSSSGTGGSAALGVVRIAGKTGTAQNVHGRDHAWFIAFAPYKDPQIAVALIVENGGYGGDAAAPLVAAAIRYYLFHDTYTSTHTNAPDSVDAVRDSTQAVTAP